MPIVVVPYDPDWPARFEALRSRIWPVVADVAVAIEHVGSTAVPGLAAKPIIDLDIVVPSPAVIPTAITRLAAIGYEHQGDLGVPGREAFRAPADPPAHHLYVCPAGSLALRNHLVLRDRLRADPVAMAEYGELKLRIAPGMDDVEAYAAAKSRVVLAILAAAGLGAEELDRIAAVNLPPG